METFERLSSPVPDRSQSVPLPPLTTMRKLTPAEEKRSVEHLYTQCLKQKKEKLEKLEKSLYSTTVHTVAVDPDELTSIVGRLYEQSVKEKESRLEKLTAERLKACHSRKVKKFESNDELVSVVTRLYDTSAKEKQRSDELFARYNPTNPVLKRSRFELEQNDKRYFEGGFAKKS